MYICIYIYIHTSFFKVTLWSPKWRSPKPWKGHLQYRSKQGHFEEPCINHTNTYDFENLKTKKRELWLLMTGAMTANDRSYDYDLMKRKKQAANNANLRIVAATNRRLFWRKTKNLLAPNHFWGGVPVGRSLIHNQVSSPQLATKKQPPAGWSGW